MTNSDDNAAVILHRLDEHGEKLDEIVAQAKITNGRISKLELWQAGVVGAVKTISWLPAVLTGVITGVLVAVLTH